MHGTACDHMLLRDHSIMMALSASTLSQLTASPCRVGYPSITLTVLQDTTTPVHMAMQSALPTPCSPHGVCQACHQQLSSAMQTMLTNKYMGLPHAAQMIPRSITHNLRARLGLFSGIGSGLLLYKCSGRDCLLGEHAQQYTHCRAAVQQNHPKTPTCVAVAAHQCTHTP